MPRALSITRSVIPASERTKYLARLRARKAHYSGAHCRFWVFEESAMPGAFLEFMESGDGATLAAAHAAAPEPVLDAGRIYVEVELP